MAASSLSSQLAALQPQGSGVATRRHEDAIGRGIHHSVHVGHFYLNPNYKASLLYDKHKARDVDNASILAQARTSLQHMVEQSAGNTTASILAAKLRLPIHDEENSKKEDIQTLLDLVSQRLPEQSAKCGHIMEYLIRFHHIHIHFVQPLLMAVLPHHEHAFFVRLVQLVDLMSNHWTWMRPFTKQPLPRRIISKQIATGNIFLLQQLLDTAKRHQDSYHTTTAKNRKNTKDQDRITAFVAGVGKSVLDHHSQFPLAISVRQELALATLNNNMDGQHQKDTKINKAKQLVARLLLHWYYRWEHPWDPVWFNTMHSRLSGGRNVTRALSNT